VPLHADFDQAPKLLTQKELDLGDYQELRKAADKPLRFNVGNTSHVVVNYAPELLEDILVNSQNLTHIDKLQLFHDLRHLDDSDLPYYSNIIPLLKEFLNSDSVIVNETLYSIVNNLKFFVTPDSTDETNLMKFVNTLSADQVQRLSW